jgi:hypothetical protein
MGTPPGSMTERFSAYFSRPVAQAAAASLSEGAEMEFRIPLADNGEEIFAFRRQGGRNEIRSGPAAAPQVSFRVPLRAAENILAETSEEIGEIGVHILKQLLSGDPETRVRFKIRAGFLGLWSKGYFGVVAAGGTKFASFLASKGLTGIGALKDALLRNLRS